MVVGSCADASTDLIEKIDSSKFARNVFILNASECKAKLESYVNKCKRYLTLLKTAMSAEEDFNYRTSRLHKRYHFKSVITKNKIKKVEDRICLAAAGKGLSALDVESEVEDSEDEDESEVQSDDD